MFLYLSFFSAAGKEIRRQWEIVQEDVGCTGATTSFITPWCSEEAKRLGSVGVVKRHSKNEHMHHPTPHTTHTLHRGIRQLYPKWAPQLPWSLPKLRVQRQNPPVGSESPRATRARHEATQRVANNWCIQSPIKGTQHPQASYLCPDQEVSFRPLCVG
jgi:hypothetical protein